MTAMTLLIALLGLLAPSEALSPSPVLPARLRGPERPWEAYDDGERVESMIVELAGEYGVDQEAALRIARCESSLVWNARNPNSSATGVYQWLEGSWEAIGSPGDRMDPEDNIRAFMEWWPRTPGWWECR